MDLFGKHRGAAALSALPFAIRRRLVARYLNSLAFPASELAAYAREQVPMYRELHGFEASLFAQLPLLTDEHLTGHDSSWLMSRKDGAGARFTARTPSGAWCFLTPTDLLTLGASALLHPRVRELKAALDANGAAMNLAPFGASIHGPCGERLARHLGGRVTNVCGLSAGKTTYLLSDTRPALAVGSLRRFARLIHRLQDKKASACKAVLQDLTFFVHIDPDGPVGPEVVQEISHRWGVEVIDTFADHFAFAFFRCHCGHIHVPPHYVVEVVDEDGHSAAHSGQLVVTDRTRKAMPLVRYATRFKARLYSSPCTFHGQTLSVEWLETRGKSAADLQVLLKEA